MNSTTPSETKRCGKCGACGWSALPLVGHFDDGVDVIETRRCPCRSTVSQVVGTSDGRVAS